MATKLGEEVVEGGMERIMTSEKLRAGAGDGDEDRGRMGVRAEMNVNCFFEARRRVRRNA